MSRGFVVRGNADGWYRVRVEDDEVEVYGPEIILLVKGEDNS